MNIHSSLAFDLSLAEELPVDGFRDASVLVIGDLILDKYILGDVTRISPEAPVPVLTVRGERFAAGGAGNVALNVVGLNARAILAGVVGCDVAGERLLAIMAHSDVNTTAVIADPDRPTTSKTRVMCQNHQIVRMDHEVCDEIAPSVCERLYAGVLKLLDKGISAVILSDYAKGVLTVHLTESLIEACNQRRIPVLVDPKRSDYTPYSGATCLTPNWKEFKAALHAMAIQDADTIGAAARLRERIRCTDLLVTQGAGGMTLITPSHAHHFPALAEEVFDVSGAGDTVIACLAVALAGRCSMLTAVQIANAAASIVVKRAGTAPIEWESFYRLVADKSKSATHENATPGIPPSMIHQTILCG